jgi:hypothetical protein
MRKKDLLETASNTAPEPPTPPSLDPRAYGLIKAGYSINETIDLVPLGRSSIYGAIKDGRLKVAKYGKRTVILAPDLAKFLSSLTREAA